MGRMVVWIVVFSISVACVDSEDSIPKQVEDFLSEDDILALESVGMNIYRGSNPPNIEGSYLASTLEVFYDDLNTKPSDEMAHYTYDFENQGGDKVTVGFSAPAANDSATDLDGYISGSGDCFNVFVEIKGTDDGCSYTMPSIFSGCVSSDGIAEWQWGYVMGERVGTSCGSLKEGHRRIFIEGDELATKL